MASAGPLELYGRLPSIEAIAISPDGARVGLITTDGEQRRIVIKELSDGKLSHVLGVGLAKVRGVLWAGNDHLILLNSKTATIFDLTGPRREWLMAFDYNLKTRKTKLLMNDVRDSLNTIFDEPVVRIIDGKAVLLAEGVHFVDNHGVLSIFQIDLERDTGRLITIGEATTEGYVLGRDGTAVAQSTYNSKTGRWSLKLKAAKGWTETRILEAKAEAPALIGLGRDGKSVLVEELVDGAGLIREVAPDGTWSAPLQIEEDESPIFDPVGHQLIGYAALIGQNERYNFFDERDQNVWNSVLKAYPDQRVRLVSWSDDRQRLVVRADSPTEGAAYALVDVTAHTASWISSAYATLTEADIASVRTLEFKAQDGLMLSGYLTVPRGFVAKNLPLVVFPHGGPAARDEPGFDWWAQAMASRGYAVLQVNFRGSGGFGWKFLSSGFGQWGRKMQTDLSDGVRYLAKEGIVDPKRVCIVGASYGGYAAMAGPTLDPGVYRCAASYAGVSDLASFTPWVKEQNGVGSQRYLIRFLGAESTRDPSLSQMSPAKNVDKVTVPILLIHGKDDTVVPLAQSQTMAAALRKAGKPVELLVLDSTDHWLTKGETRLAMLRAIVAFLEKNNPPK